MLCNRLSGREKNKILNGEKTCDILLTLRKSNEDLIGIEKNMDDHLVKAAMTSSVRAAMTSVQPTLTPFAQLFEGLLVVQVYLAIYRKKLCSVSSVYLVFFV